jgi:hypothetical protein
MLDAFLPGFLDHEELVYWVFRDETNVCVSIEIAHITPSGLGYERGISPSLTFQLRIAHRKVEVKVFFFAAHGVTLDIGSV